MPTRIISVEPGKRKPNQKGITPRVFICDDGNSYTLNSLSALKNIGRQKLQRRFEKLCKLGAQFSTAIFYPYHLSPKVMAEEFGVDVGITVWDRTKCKRDHVLCKNYHSCVDKRLGISPEKWIAPENTDVCYKAVKIPRYGLYPSALNCPSTFGVLGE